MCGWAVDIQTLDEGSKTYEAVNYALGHWTKLCRYLYYADASIDNNPAEQAIRPSKLGMKNWLFVGHPQAGQRAAIIYTIVQNCKNHGIDPQAYMTDVLERLPLMSSDPEQIRLLRPKFWKKIVPDPEGVELPFTALPLWRRWSAGIGLIQTRRRSATVACCLSKR